jgi:hypothetical protein
MSFKTEIEAIVGDIDSPDYTAQAAIYLVDGVKYITKYVMKDPDMAERLTSSSTLNNSTPTLAMNSVLHIHSVVRGDGTRNRKAIEIESDDADDYTDVNSIYYTSKFDPKYYVENDVLKVIPTPTSSQTALVKKIAPDSSVAVTDSSVTNFPEELERGIVLYASKELLRKFLSSKNASLPADMSIPSTPSSASVSTVTVGSLGSPPAYSKTALQLTAAPNIGALTIQASVPSVISLGTVVYVDPSAGDATATSVADVTIGSVTDANVTTNIPTYSKPTTTADYAAGSTGVDDWITDEDPEMAQVALEKQSQLLQNYQLDIQNELNEFQKENVRYEAEIQEELAKHNTALQRAISLAQIQAADAQQTAQQATQVDLANKQKDLQLSLENKAKDMDAIMANNQSLVSDYSARVQSYQAQVTDEVQQYQANLEKELSLFNTKRNTELQKHNNDIQDELNEFQKELSIYQADLQQKIEQAGISSQKEAMEIQNYQMEVESYGQQVAKEVQNFNSKLTKLTTDYNWYVMQYQMVQQDLVEFLTYYITAPRMEEIDETSTDD